MDQSIWTPLLAAVASIVVTWITVVYTTKRNEQKLADEIAELKAENQKISKQLKSELDNSLVSTGVALGYYRNFIKRIFDNLLEGNTIIVDNLDTEAAERMEYSLAQVSLRVIIPSDLTAARIQDAIDEEKVHAKMMMHGKGNKRGFTFHASYSANSIEVIDFPNPLEAVNDYLLLLPQFQSSIQVTGKVDRTGVTEELRERYRMEIGNFTETINFLVRKNNSTVNRVGFKVMT